MKRGTVWQRHRRSCPRLPDGGYRPHKCHGPWAFQVDVVRREGGQRRRETKSGFATKRAAELAMRQVLAREESGLAGADQLSTGEYLGQWLAGKRALRATTVAAYRSHLRLYLLPHLGPVRLAELRPEHLDRMYEAIGADGQRLSATTIRRIHATLKSALNSAVKRRLIPWNPALHIELPTPTRAQVRVWTAEQVRTFLHHTRHDRLFTLYHLVAMTGLRRGEVIGLRWADIDLDTGVLRVVQQITHAGGVLRISEPKTRRSVRTVPLDEHTAGLLRGFRERQRAEREQWGPAWVDTGLVFTREDGELLLPDYVFRHFRRLTRQAGLPPIRLHDLRHTSASLALAAGVPMKVVSDRLGHSTIGITADLYTHVAPAVARDAATRIADLIRGDQPPGEQPPERHDARAEQDRRADGSAMAAREEISRRPRVLRRTKSQLR